MRRERETGAGLHLCLLDPAPGGGGWGRAGSEKDNLGTRHTSDDSLPVRA